MAKRLCDIVASVIGLIIFSPLFVLAAVGIRFSSPGPILFRAGRVGKDGKEFIMYKFRTMHCRTEGTGSAITSANDSRVFPFGSVLRTTKIDELPQLINVLFGAMSIVGPRPEDPGIVRKHYTQANWETLTVKPGLASPGSIYNYTHGDLYLTGEDTEARYIEELLPVKLALEQVYVRRSSLLYDLTIVMRTISTIIQIALGKSNFNDPPEMPEALALLEQHQTFSNHASRQSQ